MSKKKWCVSVSGDGWGYVLHPYRGEEDDGPDTIVYSTFGEAKRECLQSYAAFLREVRGAVRAVKKQRANPH